MRTVTVAKYMTRGPHTIGLREPLATAHRMMNEFNVRHLPVLEEGKLAGIVSQRDLHFIETLQDVDPRRVSVEEAMTQETYTVPAKTSLAVVASEMAARKVGSALVLDDDDRIAGIFTTTDALRALADAIEDLKARETIGSRPRRRRPSE